MGKTIQIFLISSSQSFSNPINPGLFFASLHSLNHCTPFKSADKMQVERVESVFVIIFLVAVLAAFLPVVGIFIVPFAVAVTFTTLFYPVYKWLLKHLWNNKIIASMSTCFVFVLIILIPAYIFVQLVVGQFIELYNQLQPLVQGLISDGSKSRLGKWFLNSPFAGILKVNQIDWSSTLQQWFNAVANFSSKIIQKTSLGTLGLILDIIIILFTMFYLFVDGAQLINKFQFLLPMRQEYKDQVFTRFRNVSSATIIGTILVGIIQGIVGAITLLIFGIENWLLWGAVMLVISIVPLVGPPIVMIPAGIYQIAVGNLWQGIGILFSSFIVVSAIDNFLRPRIVGERAHIHDLIIFFSTLGGLGLFGIWGFIIGPAVSALFVAALQIFSDRFQMVLSHFNKPGSDSKTNAQ